MLCIVPSSQFSPGLGMEATMRPLRATVLRPACPATSSSVLRTTASDNGRPLSRPPLYSPHWPIVPPCPNPRPIRSSEGAARHCALGRSAAAGSGPALEPGQRPIVRLVHCAAALTPVFSLGKAARGFSGGLEPGLSVVVTVYSDAAIVSGSSCNICSLLRRDHCHFRSQTQIRNCQF